VTLGRRAGRLLVAVGLGLACIFVGDVASWAATAGWVIRYPTAVTSTTVTAYVEHPASTKQTALRISCSLGGVESFFNAAFWSTLEATTEPFTAPCPPGAGIPTGQWWLRECPAGGGCGTTVDHINYGDTVQENGWAPPEPEPEPEGPAPCGEAAADPCAVHVASVDGDTYGGYGVGLVAAVFLLAALLAAQLRR
jgi:hypothetical protein